MTTEILSGRNRGLVTALSFGSLVFTITALAGCAGCRDFVEGDKKIVRIKTEEGQKMIKQLQVSPEKARELALSHQDKLQQGPWCDSLELLVGDEYVISLRHKMKIELRGYYVDGNTGAIRYVDTDEYVCP